MPFINQGVRRNARRSRKSGSRLAVGSYGLAPDSTQSLPEFAPRGVFLPLRGASVLTHIPKRFLYNDKRGNTALSSIPFLPSRNDWDLPRERGWTPRRRLSAIPFFFQANRFRAVRGGLPPPPPGIRARPGFAPATASNFSEHHNSYRHDWRTPGAPSHHPDRLNDDDPGRTRKCVR